MATQTNRTGEKRMMNNGMCAVIISYRKAIDIDVQFDDGYIAQHVAYSSFCKGQIANKNIRIAAYNAEKHVGEKVKAKCGLIMELIAYRTGKDIDIKFEDGTIVYGASYYSFCKGSIGHPHINKGVYQVKRTAFTNRIGEENINNDGDKMRILNYRSARDIDIQFQDETIVTCRKYEEFKSGQIKNPNRVKNSHIGKRFKCNNGLYATIIDYCSYNDVTVVFEDGYVKEHVRYNELKKGSVGHPDYIRKNGNILNIKKNDNARNGAVTVIEAFRQKRLGEEKLMRCGLIGEVIEYNGVRDIKVRFPNGQEKRTDWKTFESGRVKPDGFKDIRFLRNKEQRIGSKSIAHNGLTMTVIGYESATDMTVKFENGYIKEHVSWDCFISGSVSCPTVSSRANVSLNEYCIMYYLKPYGFIHYSDKKSRFEIDILHQDKRIGIEYDGQVFHDESRLRHDMNKNKICQNKGITLYRIREPKCPEINGNVINRKSQDCFCDDFTDSIKTLISILNERHGFNIIADVDVVRDRNDIANSYGIEYSIIGETSVSNAGDTMKIIAFRNHKDIDVMFDDGTIVEHKAYHHFKTGEIGNPNHYKNVRLGMRKKMNNGLMCTITKYYNSQKIDVTFDDGTVIEGRSFSDFQLGCISHPCVSTQSISAKHLVDKYVNMRIGESKTNKKGMIMTITAYNNANDINVAFEDGSVIHGISYRAFERGTVYPNSLTTHFDMIDDMIKDDNQIELEDEEYEEER